MKVTIEFDLDNYEKGDKTNLEMALDSSNMYLALYEFNYNAWKKLEWEIEQKENMDNFDVLNLVFDRFREILENNKVDLTKWG